MEICSVFSLISRGGDMLGFELISGGRDMFGFFELLSLLDEIHLLF
jgi:hypothetical protein